MNKWLWLPGVLAVLVVIGHFGLRLLDGPLGPLPGGPLTSGDWVETKDVDWLAQTHGKILTQEHPYFVELELVDAGTSRTTGILFLEDAVYIPCDLGFGWARFSGPQRWILQFIYIFKNWHRKIAQDSRVVLRMEGRRYARRAVRVTDPGMIEALRIQLEVHTQRWLAPEPLAPRPTRGPRDIWFFRLD